MAQKYGPVLLRRLVRARAGERCEYCLIPEHLTMASHWMDHVVAEKHGGQAEEGNRALSCVSPRRQVLREHHDPSQPV